MIQATPRCLLGTLLWKGERDGEIHREFPGGGQCDPSPGSIVHSIWNERNRGTAVGFVVLLALVLDARLDLT